MQRSFCMTQPVSDILQVHTNIVVFDLRKSAPLTAKDFILVLQQRGVLVIPFRCAPPGFPLEVRRGILGESFL